jgi:putative membrane protein
MSAPSKGRCDSWRGDLSVWDHYPALLLVAFATVFAASGLRPLYPADWLLENILVIVAVPLLVRGYFERPFSDAAYTGLFVFLVLHEIGAHYTYSEVPYDDWSVTITGYSINDLLGWERNHYDRLVHFLYGFLLTGAAWEMLGSLLVERPPWRYVLTFCFMLSLSALYELIEAGAAFLFGRDLGIAYLGTQGDVWDAQKDMAAACAGTLVALAMHHFLRVGKHRSAVIAREKLSVTKP